MSKFDISFSFKDPLLNGTKGTFRVTNRKEQPIGVDTDHEAIHKFLDVHANKPQTLRSYTKESERILLWAILKANKPLSSFTIDDFNSYIEFMKAPDKDWCGKKSNKDTEEWRPFTGSLSESAVKTAVTIINSMFNWLVKAGYLTGNPLGLIRKRGKTEVDKKVERFLDDDMWSALLHSVETMPINTDADTYHQERMRFMLSFFSLLGARISELANCKMGDFRNDVAGWFWHVNGKGDKDAIVAMPQDMVDALMRWREFLGLSALPRNKETTAAIPFVTRANKPLFNREGIQPRRINQILEEFFEMAAIKLEEGGQQDKAEKIKMASAHWLRHTSVTQKMNAGIARHIVQKEARHAKMETTNMYSHDEEKVRAAEAQKHKIAWARK